MILHHFLPASVNKLRERAIAVFAALMLMCPAVSIGQTSVGELNALVDEQAYSQALEALQKTRMGERDQIAWLREKAKQGHVPLQYELSRRLFPTDLPESLKWYARGRLARTLDVAECKDAISSLPARIELDRASEAIVKAGQANPKLFNAAILDALSWDERRTKVPSSKWICGESNPPSPEGAVLPANERKLKRDEARLTMASRARLEVANESATERGRRANYRIVDSGFPLAESSPGTSVYWLDNERVVFLGYDVGRLLPLGGGGSNYSVLNGVFIWAPKTKSVSPLFQADEVGKLCVFREFISFYARFRDNTENVLEGTLDQFHSGRFARKPHDWKRYPNRSRWPRCDGVPPAPRGNDESRFVFLLPEHGYVDLHRPEWTPKAEGYTLFPPGDKRGIRLNFPGLSTTNHIQYVEQRNAYMVTGDYFGPDMTRDPGNFPRLADRFFYWLYPDGRTQKETQRFGACTYTGGGGLVTQRGYLRGFCLMAHDGEEMVVPASARSGGDIALSPDGCKVAFGATFDKKSPSENQRERNAGRPGSMTLKMIDLCVGENRGH